MELFQFSIFLILLSIFLFFLPYNAHAQSPFLINCGSSNNVTTTAGQTFVGDEKTNTVRLSGHGSKTDTDSNQPEALYQTARVFKKTASYDFDISQFETYFVRLHFCAFDSSLADAKFNVSASGHMLLTDFSPAGKTDANCTRNSTEFILKITDVKFRIYFVPSHSSSIAFVNAIEIFPTSSNITEDTGPRVTPAGSLGDDGGQKSKVLETIYRINVGDIEVEASSSSLWRSWMPDDQYLINKGDAENAPAKIDSVNYASGPGQATIDDAPPEVYGTAKIPKKSLSMVNNLTWKFNVSKGKQYFVRVHFYDIISPASSPYNFSLYMYSNFNQVIDPLEIAAADHPFYKDYLVEPDDLGYLNISVGPNNVSVDKKYLFLNGLEIMQVLNETAIEPRIDGSPSHLALVASLVASAVAILIVLAAVAFWYQQKKKRQKSKEVSEWVPMYGAFSSHNRISDGTSSHASTFQNLQLGLKIPFVEIRQITNNFAENLIIGEGGFGKVYKGTLRSGLKVAVKRGSPDHGQGMSEFQTEIMILSSIRHRHLVSLIGYCYENGEMILVYEYMEKGTLRYHLYESENISASSAKGMLSWKQRLEICIGAAKGLQYLHTGTNKGIIHRDVKSTNILLDENYVAKVADFGLSRSGYLEETHVSISDVKGTLGYLDPEYIICLQLTEKSDVYAFGVVLFEVLCARAVIDQSLPKEQISLPDWATACLEEGQIEKIIDPLIANEIEPNSLKQFCETAEKCLKKDASERPPMSDVCWSLEYTLQLQKAAAEGVLLDDTTTDVSLNMPLPAVHRFPSQNISDFDLELSYTGTGEVFSQLTYDDATGR
ncbi:probable receptor-like protein kinase At2g23200 [Chenopodium quinoa]|uniref:probable receptor-like protein kinase At2g23200 n=1 Tax=Chenopodium quinoa TaxID=63459 RepID=UPI000B77036B|nr:probable receptor-like protein kinase At2g23200 [Chenopodium quinoa]